MKRLIFALALALSIGVVHAADYNYKPVPDSRISWYNPRGISQDQLAHIMIVRDSAFFESSMKTGMYCDDYLVADLMQGELVPFNVRPGEHKLTNGFGSNLHHIKINVEANHYYLYKLVWDGQRRGYNIILVEDTQ